MRYLGGWLACMLFISAAVAQTTQVASPFRNAGESSGVHAIVDRQYQAVPKWWLSGMTLVDLDGDGHLDLHLAGHGSPAVVGRNDGKGHFAWVDPRSDIPRGKNKADAIPYGGGEIRLVYDIDEDGKPDLLCSYGDGLGVVYRNEGSPGVFNFRPVTTGFDAFSRGAALADLDRDGKVDYAIGTDGPKDKLLVALGRGGGRWEQKAQIPVLREAGVIPVDVDGDGFLDLLVSQRGYNKPGRAILRSDGKMNFVDVTADAGLDAAAGSIHGAGDVDQNGTIDLVCIEGRDVLMYLGDGRGKFARGAPVKLKGRSAIKDTNWGGVVVTDIDNDGVADVLVNGKHFLYVLRGIGGGRFEHINPPWSISSGIAPAVDEGLCFGDIDGDGDLDVITYDDSRPKERGVGVFVNDVARGNWLRVQLIGRPGNRAAANATIRVLDPARPDRAIWTELVLVWGRQSFHSYYAMGNTERHFGLGDRETVDVRVEFYPSGKTLERKGVKANGTIVMREEE